ncbi:MAG: family 20 glycosylhydrolase [Cytophagales bacterium]|nr:family 20 glycosylhydrolase [Cytophagales bacterium]
MRILLSVLFILSIFCLGCTGEGPGKDALVPQPSSIVYQKGKSLISESTQIYVSGPELLPLAKLLQKSINTISGMNLEISPEDRSENTIKLIMEEGLASEHYRLIVSEEIRITASSYNSIAMGLSTLIQLMNPDTETIALKKVIISDKPDFGYRSVMLDVARFWHPIETIKETVDLLWFYKIRYLHLHLSDNRRFTFPMDEFPKLKTVNNDGAREYYTIDELRDLVEYARLRGITIVPEVDLPGHSNQLWQKYPEVFGSIDPVSKKARSLYVVNMANEKTYRACEKIIRRLADVFYTSPYIHVGGDEVYLEVIKSIPEYKSFCEKHRLNVALKGDANELFCYFINRMDEMVKAAGKKSILWEGFHGTGAGSQTISKEIPVIVWNTTYNHPDSLLNNGYKIINSTWIPWYLVGAMNLAAPQEKGYNWDVTHWSHWNEQIENIKISSKAGIQGGQISFWEQNHYKVIPLLKESVPVLSERLWNNNAVSDFGGFQNRYTRANSIYETLFNPVKIKVSDLLHEQDQTFLKTAEVKLESDIPGTIRFVYSDSWKLPDMKSGIEYKQPFAIEKSGILTVQLYDKKNEAIGFPVQQYYQKIIPAYHYRVFGPAPQHGWDSMPDFKELGVIREGVTGLMTLGRLEKINGELFAKVKKEGHIEVRFNGLYNPYALELAGVIHIPEKEEYEFRIQTHDGLAELYIDATLVGKGKEFDNKPEDFYAELDAGAHEIVIKYFYRKIQNQLSILYKTSDMDTFLPFEGLVAPLD